MYIHACTRNDVILSGVILYSACFFFTFDIFDNFTCKIVPFDLRVHKR